MCSKVGRQAYASLKPESVDGLGTFGSPRSLRDALAGHPLGTVNPAVSTDRWRGYHAGLRSELRRTNALLRVAENRMRPNSPRRNRS